VLRYNLEKISLKPSTSWDKKWRIVLFDIPEKNKKARDVLRFHLKKMGFFEYQKSVFITPHNCEKEIEFISEFYRIKPFIRIIIATKLDNEFHLKSHFKLR
jgi:CRISPR-associated endonuclease Cas2